MLPIRTSIPIEQRETTNVTVPGDAIHSMTPLRGISANTALRDAQLLARSVIATADGQRDLRGHPPLRDANDRLRLRRVRPSVRTAEQTISTNWLGRSMFRSALRLFAADPFAQPQGVRRSDND
ncbi:FAD-dependent monooxygenase [Actinophytocola sp.]|uniref:FAD-dependent monooxygenase n=1 Tax=Actinophytocola sp. TaxID=1872138 RepID=UPI0039C85522